MVSPEFWPEPGVRALEVGVHLHVVLEVLEHLRLEIDVPVLDYYHPLNEHESSILCLRTFQICWVLHETEPSNKVCNGEEKHIWN